MNSIWKHMEPQGDQNGNNGLFVARQQIIDERVGKYTKYETVNITVC